MTAISVMEIGGAPFFLHEVNLENPAETSPDQAGATSVRIEDHRVPWGAHRQGGFVDPFGHRWSVGDGSPLRPGIWSTRRSR